MEKTTQVIYDELFEKNASVFRRGESRNIMKLLEKYLGSSDEAMKAMENIEGGQGWLRKLIGKTGIQPFAADAEQVVQRHLPKYIKNLQGMSTTKGSQKLKDHRVEQERKVKADAESYNEG